LGAAEEFGTPEENSPALVEFLEALPSERSLKVRKKPQDRPRPVAD
jgi:hypothetical protein